MRILYLGFLSTDKQIDILSKNGDGMPVQTHLFGCKLISILSNICEFTTSVSFIPIQSYPKDNEIVIKGTGFITSEGVRVVQGPFINVTLIKHITRLIYLLYVFLKNNKKWNATHIVVHGVHSPYLLFSYIVEKLYGIKICVVVTDPPGVELPSDSKFSKVLKNLDKKFISFLLKKFSGVVLSEKIKNDYMPNSKCLVMDGFSSVIASNKINTVFEDQNYNVLYAGILDEKYGVQDLVDAILLCEIPNVKLHLFGNGPMCEYLSSLSNDKIIYHGYKDVSIIHKYYNSVNLLVNPRNPKHSFVKYSFPSKLLEYLSSGTPTLTTELPSISKDLKPYFHFYDGTVPGLISKIQELQNADDEELNKTAYKGKIHVSKTRSFNAYQGKFKFFLENQ